MPEEQRLKKPWLVAVWPGMGQVAINAGYYLMSKLDMHLLAEFSPREFFEVEYAEVKGGLIHTGRLPRSRLFAWTNPHGEHDLIVFIGEAQPPRGKYAFCRLLIEYARGLGVEHVFTFAAMGTTMHPEHDARVFGAATTSESLEEIRRLGLEILEDGHIGGLNGVLVGVAAESAIHGACLLGEMPQIFAQLPFPKASLAVLHVFARLTGITVDFEELAEQAQDMDQRLGGLLEQVERAYESQTPTEEEMTRPEPAEDEEKLRPEDRHHLDRLFEQARQDRSKAYELKRELDRLEVYPEYEDRFLDLFKKPE